jgi:hypothetical protein
VTLIKIGVTGHRYLDELDKVMMGVENVIQRILETFLDSDFRILSSLAEGADQILAKRLLLVPNTHLWVPLPLSEEEYLKDFGVTRSKEEFIHLLRKAERIIKLPEMDNREDCYEAVGKFIVKNSNILIAIWDGKPAQGKGGTAEIVALARTHNLPLAYIHAGNRVPGTSVSTSLGHEQGMVTFENFPMTNGIRT